MLSSGFCFGRVFSGVVDLVTMDAWMGRPVDTVSVPCLSCRSKIAKYSTRWNIVDEAMQRAVQSALDTVHAFGVLGV